MICQCQSRTRPCRRRPFLPSAAKLSSHGRAEVENEIAASQAVKLTLCECPFVMDSWPFPQLPGSPATHFGKREVGAGELQSGIIVRGRMQPPQLLHTNNRGTPARDTGVAGALNPAPADRTPGLAARPSWPLALGLSSRNAHSGPIDVHLPNDATHQQTQILLEVPNACVLWAPKQVTRSINKKDGVPGQGIYVNLQDGSPRQRRCPILPRED